MGIVDPNKANREFCDISLTSRELNSCLTLVKAVEVTGWIQAMVDDALLRKSRMLPALKVLVGMCLLKKPSLDLIILDSY